MDMSIVFPHGAVVIEDPTTIQFSKLMDKIFGPASDNEEVMNLHDPQYAG